MDEDHILLSGVNRLLDDCECSQTWDMFKIWTSVCSYSINKKKQRKRSFSGLWQMKLFPSADES